MASGPQVGPKTFRFRVDREPDTPDGQRCWKARYSYEGGWAPFEITVDFDRRICSFHRAPGIPYGGLLCDLVESMIGVETASAPLVRRPVSTLTFPCEIIGYDMSRHADVGGGIAVMNGPAAYFRDNPPGAWLVLRAALPETGQSFLLAINDRRGAGEIVSGGPQDGLAVIEAFTDVFADTQKMRRA